MQVFPQTPNSLACFSVNNKNTQWGNASEKQIHLLPASLARLHGGDGQVPPQPREGERFGRTPPLWAEGWHLPGAAAPVPGEGAGGEARGAEGDKPPLPGRRPSQLQRGQGSRAAHPSHCWCSPALAFLLGRLALGIMLVAQQLKHLHGLEFAFLLALGLRLLLKFWGCKGRLLLRDADGCTRIHAQQGQG